MKKIWTGLESSGKSLAIAREVDLIVARNGRWFKKTGVPRPIVSNLRFSQSFETYAKERNVPIEYWCNLDEIVGREECDIVIDEIGAYFDSRLWTELSLDTRRWLAQTAKRGVEIYGTAQDFAQVDKSFRRLVNSLEYVIKVVGSRRPAKTKPAVKSAWGICWLRTLEPRSYEEDKKEFGNPMLDIFNWLIINKQKVNIYDTRQLMELSTPPPLRHVERSCPICGKIHIKHD